MEPSQNGFAVLLIILIIAAAALAGGGVYIYQTQIADKEPAPAARKKDGDTRKIKEQEKDSVQTKEAAGEKGGRADAEETQKTTDQNKPAGTVDSANLESVEPRNESAEQESEKEADKEIKTGEKSENKIIDNKGVPISWEAAGFTDPEKFMDFVSEFQVMVAGGQKEAIAELVKYPIEGAADKQEFIKNYSIIFNQKVRQAVIGQDAKQIWRNYQGAMIGSGEVWFGEIPGAGYRIIAINN